ncbi:MAG: FAD-binding oxidoreductase [Candidatus Obscuribacterales bacterium]|nr:FAD-binding oxidoreductase [Candidatus Obscuribacterales bacterium]
MTIERLVPKNSEELTKMLAEASDRGYSVYPGHLSFLPPEYKNDVGRQLSLENMSSIVEHSVADQVICVESGMSLKQLAEITEKTNQFFPAYRKDPSTTILDLLNEGENGPIEHGYGSLRDIVLGLTVMQPSGAVIKCGGRVVKNVSGYDLTKLFIGSRGALGIILQAHLRLFAKPESSKTLILAYPTVKECFTAAISLRQSGIPVSCLEIAESKLFAKICQEPQLQLLQNEPVARDNNRFACYLFVQLHGLTSVISELQDSVRQIAGARHSCYDLPTAVEASFWNIISEPATQENVFNLASTNAFIQELLLSDSTNTWQWTCRPGKNRLKLLSFEQQPLIAETITRLSQNSKSAFTMIYRDQDHIMRLVQDPPENEVLKELKERIKKEYDPRMLLNTLSQL